LLTRPERGSPSAPTISTPLCKPAVPLCMRALVLAFSRAACFDRVFVVLACRIGGTPR
jgi:hypothetical protein